jgi:hypothetical protein
MNKIYACVINRKDHLINKETGQYNAEEFIKYPDKYTSTFKTKVSYLYKHLRYKPFFLINRNFRQQIASKVDNKIYC